MKRSRFLPSTFLLLSSLVAPAAIPLNSVQTLDEAPGTTNWATRNVGGSSSSILNPANLDLAVQTNDAALLTDALQITSGSGGAGVAQWSLTDRRIVTRPNGVAYQLLLATLQNTSGHDLSSVAVAYDFGNPAPAPANEDPGLNGLRTYYSQTGQAGSWWSIPELSTSQAGPVAAVVPIGSWPAGSPLYLLWADDNGSPGTDSAFTIDNFIALESLPPPPPPSVQPPATNVVQGKIIQLTFVGTGYGLTFQWSKDGVPIDPLLNPTARERRLVITNASPADAGQYRLAVSNLAGEMLSDVVPVHVDHTDLWPVFVRFVRIVGATNLFRLTVSEPLCEGSSCPNDADALLPFNWLFEEVGGHSYVITSVTSTNGTNYDFEMEEFVFDQTKRYRIGPDPAGPGITDPFGSFVPMGSVITNTPTYIFKQNFEGYLGTEDVEVTPPCPDPSCPKPISPRILVDLNNGGNEAQGLLRFNNIFGDGPDQIRPGARIISATLHLESTGANANGNPVNLHRMLQPWSQATATWDSFVNGIQADGLEAHTSVDATIISDLESVPFEVAVDVTKSLQSWSDGASNFGWVLLATGTDGYIFDTSELPTAPTLEVVADSSIVEPFCYLLGVDFPGSLTVIEGGSFTLVGAVRSTGFCLLSFQWQKDGVNIPPPAGTAGPSLSITSASICDAGSYRLIVLSLLTGQSVTSNPAIVNIPDDIVRPVLTRAFASPNGTSITLTFSKVMNSTNAPSLAHYSMDPPLLVTDAALSPDGRSVTLTTALRAPLTVYMLRIQDVTDNRATCGGSIGNFISPNPTLVQLTDRRIDVPWNAEWLYSTNNQDSTLSTAAPWYAPNFAPGPDWITGQALFGTETSASVLAELPAPLVTAIPPNTNSPPDQTTTYFRKQIDLPPLPSGTTYALCHFIDDGAVFYLDGVEVGRVNMTNPPPVLFAHRASVVIEASLQCLPFTATAGPHVVAVEVHQGGATTSSDILFGVEIETLTAAPWLDIGRRVPFQQPFLSWQADSYWDLVTSSNAGGPYVPVAANPFQALGTYSTPSTNPATFFRLRYKGSSK